MLEVTVLYEKFTTAWDNLDVETFISLFHEDYEMTWHSTGKTTNMQNADWGKLAYNMSASKHENRRCGKII